MKKIASLGLLCVVILSTGTLISNADNNAKAFHEIGWFEARVEGVVDGDTIRVQFANDRNIPKISHTIRFAGIDSPETGEGKTCTKIGSRAEEALSQWLPVGSQVRVMLDPTWDAYIPYQLDDFSRLLGYVWDNSGQLLQTKLVAEGLARLDVRRTDIPDIFIGDFNTLFSEQIIKAQVEAAMKNRGWWQECDPFRSADLLIAGINFWDEPQIVYIANRGEKDIQLSGYALRDNADNDLRFDQDNCSQLLSQKQYMEIQIFNLPGSGIEGSCKFHETKFIWKVEPANKNETVFNKGASTEEVACIVNVDQAFERCDANLSPGTEGLIYLYQYPPKDGMQLP